MHRFESLSVLDFWNVIGCNCHVFVHVLHWNSWMLLCRWVVDFFPSVDFSSGVFQKTLGLLVCFLTSHLLRSKLFILEHILAFCTFWQIFINTMAILWGHRPILRQIVSHVYTYSISYNFEYFKGLVKNMLWCVLKSQYLAKFLYSLWLSVCVSVIACMRILAICTMDSSFV